ncbi:MAG: FBP domain-containing protein [Pseudomonadota bacterium]
MHLPDLETVDWGVLDYLGWIHPAGHQGYVVMAIHTNLQGMVLRRHVNHGSKPRVHMCSWCNHVYRAKGTAMFTAEVSGSEGRRMVGNYICRNLDCSLRIRNLTSDPPTYMPETIDLMRKANRLQNAVTQFMARVQAFQ